jgi:hypothetical protein
MEVLLFCAIRRKGSRAGKAGGGGGREFPFARRGSRIGRTPFRLGVSARPVFVVATHRF